MTRPLPKNRQALPPFTNAPLAMHQSGWTEEVVNSCVLSSANSCRRVQCSRNWRLDIKVNMTGISKPKQLHERAWVCVMRWTASPADFVDVSPQGMCGGR